MSLLRKRTTKISYIYTFEFLREHNIEEVVNWVNDIVNSGLITIETISLWDTERNYDEGNESIDFTYPIEIKHILSALKERNIDCFILSGKFEEEPITVNCNLKVYEVNVAIHKIQLLNEYQIEKALKLSK